MLRHLAWMGLFAAGCSASPDSATGEPLGPDCAALLDVGRRAESCEPQLVAVLSAIRRAPSERDCRAAARKLLAPGSTPGERPRSLFEPDEDPTKRPLTLTELQTLASIQLPATLVVTPTSASSTAATRANIGDLALEQSQGGRLRTTVAPGLHQLDIDHAGESSRYCVELAACEAVQLFAVGARLKPHRRVQPGPCTSNPASAPL